jgi:hypothetical protein
MKGRPYNGGKGSGKLIGSVCRASPETGLRWKCFTDTNKEKIPTHRYIKSPGNNIQNITENDSK